MGSHNPKQVVSRLDTTTLPEPLLHHIPTLQRYIDQLTTAVKPADGDGQSDIIRFTPSQLPPLPSSGDLARLQEELSSIGKALQRGKSIVEGNLRILDKWLVSPDQGTEANKPAAEQKVERKKDGPKEKKFRASIAGEEQSRENKVEPVKIKLQLNLGPKKAENSDEIKTPTDSPTSQTPVIKKRKWERETEDISDSEGQKRVHTEPGSASKIGPARGSFSSSKLSVHRSVGANAKPRTSRKSGAQKNNKLKKRHSTVDADDFNVLVPDGEEKTDKPVEGDLSSRIKTTQNQVPIQTFWSFVDQYFRPLSEDDIRFLDTESDEILPYIVPALGKPYRTQWADEDARLMAQLDDQFSSSGGPFGQEYEEMTGSIREGDIYLKPLSERIIASLMENRIIGFVPPITPTTDDLDDGISFRTDGDMVELEQRMRNELRYIGLIDEDEVGLGISEEDEISKELRSLQAQLREQVIINRSRKQQLKDVARKWMAWQQYNGVLDDVNKNLEQSYIKRFKSQTKSKGKKKVLRADYRPVGENVMQDLNNRRRLIEELGGYFPKEAYTIPQTSIYSS